MGLIKEDTRSVDLAHVEEHSCYSACNIIWSPPSVLLVLSKEQGKTILHNSSITYSPILLEPPVTCGRLLSSCQQGRSDSGKFNAAPLLIPAFPNEQDAANPCSTEQGSF